MDIYFSKMSPNTIIPTKKDEDAGFDIYANFDELYMAILPNETKLIPTKLKCAINKGSVMILKERGSSGSKGMSIRAGVIDSGYRGEIFVAITNVNNKPILITKEKFTERLENDYVVYPYSKAICQGIILNIPKCDVHEITEEQLNEIPSERKDGKLGSSNK